MKEEKVLIAVLTISTVVALVATLMIVRLQ